MSCLHRRRPRKSSTRAVVPDHAQVSILARTELELELPQLLVRQVEERALAHELRPPCGVATPLELHALEERRRQTADADAVHELRGAEVDLESAQAVAGGNRQHSPRQPAWL